MGCVQNQNFIAQLVYLPRTENNVTAERTYKNYHNIHINSVRFAKKVQLGKMLIFVVHVGMKFVKPAFPNKINIKNNNS